MTGASLGIDSAIALDLARNGADVAINYRKHEGEAAAWPHRPGELARSNVNCNAVAPGLIETDMTAWVMKDPQILPMVLAQISLGRAGQPREIGTVVAFFASDEASYLTGQILHPSGGWVSG